MGVLITAKYPGAMPAGQVAFEQCNGRRRVRRISHERRIELQDGLSLRRNLSTLCAEAVLRRDADCDGVYSGARVSLVFNCDATFTDAYQPRDDDGEISQRRDRPGTEHGTAVLPGEDVTERHHVARRNRVSARDAGVARGNKNSQGCRRVVRGTGFCGYRYDGCCLRSSAGSLSSEVGPCSCASAATAIVSESSSWLGTAPALPSRRASDRNPATRCEADSRRPCSDCESEDAASVRTSTLVTPDTARVSARRSSRRDRR